MRTLTSSLIEKIEDQACEELRADCVPGGLQGMWRPSERLEYASRLGTAAGRLAQKYIFNHLKQLGENTMTTTIEKSSNIVSAFEHETFGEIRALNRDGDFWFVARYVCEALGLDNVGEALRGLDDDEKITITNPDGNPRAGIPHQFACISESGLYSLILRSRKPEAKAFKRWVTHEVLPAIRRDGGYIHTTKEDDDHTIMIKACRILKAANEKLEKQIAEAAPKAQLADDYLVEGEEISIGDLAKKLGYEGINIGPHRLFELLRNKGVLISRPGVQFNTPTQKYASRGWFKIIQPPSSMLGKWKKQIRVTPKGVMEISKRMHELYGSDL